MTPLPAVWHGGAGLGNGTSRLRSRPPSSDGTLPAIQNGCAALVNGASDGPCCISAVRQDGTLPAIRHGSAGLGGYPCDGSGLAWRGTMRRARVGSTNF